MTKRNSLDLESRLDRALAAPKPALKAPFQLGQYVEFVPLSSCEEPFRSDDVMEVAGLSKSGRGKKISWRVRVFTLNRATGGAWVSADVLQPYGEPSNNSAT